MADPGITTLLPAPSVGPASGSIPDLQPCSAEALAYLIKKHAWSRVAR